MVLTKYPSNFDIGNFSVFRDRLQRIFVAMDGKYARAADYYGFHCDGCVDNCCRSRFYHYTYLEYMYLLAGLETLDPQRQQEIQSRAREVCRETAKAEKKQIFVRHWCPLNNDGRCVLYSFRPMICRLHGIPHELQKPGQNVVYGPGCSMFDDRCSHKSYYQFDRTPFYLKMAKLESKLKKTAGISGKIRMTIAEMIVKSV